MVVRPGVRRAFARRARRGPAATYVLDCLAGAARIVPIGGVALCVRSQHVGRVPPLMGAVPGGFLSKGQGRANRHWGRARGGGHTPRDVPQAQVLSVALKSAAGRSSWGG